MLPTPDKLTVESVGLGFADGEFSYAKGSLNCGRRGQVDRRRHPRAEDLDLGLRGRAGEVEGRIGLTALPGDDGKLRLTIPNAGLLFKGGDPWSLRAEAPTATLQARPRLQLQRRLRVRTRPRARSTSARG